MEKTDKILKIIDVIFIMMTVAALVLGLWFWHKCNVAKEQYQLIEEVLMGISFDSSDSYAYLREEYLPQFADENVWGEIFPPETVSTIDGNTVHHIDALNMALSPEKVYLHMSKDGDFVANLRVVGNYKIHFSIYLVGSIHGDEIRFTKMY